MNRLHEIPYLPLVWSTIRKSPGYEVSNFGDVRNKKTCRVLKLLIKRKSYAQVCIPVDKVSKYLSVHRLVAEAFLKEYDESLQVDHIDKDSLNNGIWNLRLVTAGENSKNRAPSAETIQQIIDLYEQGLSVKEIRFLIKWGNKK